MISCRYLLVHKTPSPSSLHSIFPSSCSLQQASLVTSGYAFVVAIKSCTNAENLADGMRLHSHVIRSGLEMDPYVGNTLIGLYAKCFCLDEARSVFNAMPSHDCVSWNTMINAYAENDDGHMSLQFFYRMQNSDLMPNRVTYMCVLKACSTLCALNEGMLIHDQIIENSIEKNLSVGNTLVDMYAKCGNFQNALKTFYGIPERDVVTWSTIISGLCEQGYVHEALHFFRQMQQEDCVPNHATFFCVLKACSLIPILNYGMVIHAQIIENCFESEITVANTLIDMYSKCGSFKDAFKTLKDLPKPNVVSWTSIVVNLACQGFGWEAFFIFNVMQSEGVQPNEVTYVGILKACSSLVALDDGRLIHAHMIEHNLVCKKIAGNALLDMYGKCGSLKDAHKVFYDLPEKDTASWSSMISRYAQHGHVNDALQIFKEMQLAGARPNEVTYVSILKLCSNIANLSPALQLHSHIIKHGFDSDVWIRNSLINMYAKCGRIDFAHEIFDSLKCRDVVSWSAIITGYVERGYNIEAFNLFEKMQTMGVKPNSITFITILSTCSDSMDLDRGKSTHANVVKYGNESDVCVANALINMYATCREIQDAASIFDNSVKRDVVTWTVMIAAYIQHGCFEDAVYLFNKMNEEGIEANHATFISIFKSCSTPLALCLGKRLHSQMVEDGLDLEVSIMNSVLHMYGKCGALVDMLTVFHELPAHDVVTWSAMISLLFEYELPVEALCYYDEMLDEGVEPNNVTFLSALKTCSILSNVEQGQIIHSHVCESSLDTDISIGNILIDMYAKCGALIEADRVFAQMTRRDVVTWTALIEGYVQQGYDQDALFHFGQMMRIGITANRVTLLSILRACSNTIAIEQGKVIHAHIIEHDFYDDVSIGSSLLDMYTKCGSCEDAGKVFANLSKQDAVAWSSMVAGYARSNDHCTALHYFKGMQKQELKPDDVSFLCLLSACNHAGLLDEGLQLINLMFDCGCQLSVEHYNCVIDLLGRTGQLEVAEVMLETLPFHLGVVGLTSLLDHSKSHGDLSLGTRCFESMLD